MALEPGKNAPTIVASNQAGDRVTLEFEDPTVLYFYPRDDTPGCTIEAVAFQEALSAFAAQGASIYGVSTDDVPAHADFAEEYGLEFDLLADPDGELAASFEVDVSGGTAERVTLLLESGRVRERYLAVDPDGHAEDVLADLRALEPADR